MDSDLRQLWQLNKYLWMCLAFMLLYLPVAQAQGILTAPAWFAWLVFGLGLADGAARTYWAYRRGGTLPVGWAWAFTYLDLLLISLAVGITGGLQSDLWLLYFVVMIYESLYATPLTKRLMNVSVCVSYLLATLPHQTALASSLPPAVYARILATRLFFVVIVSALARRISANALARHQELMLLREQMATAEERARIAREIHDGLGHALVSSILRLELCARLIGRAPAEAEALLKEEIPALRAAWNEGRDLAFHLRPWEMDASREGGIIESLRRHLGRFAERTGLSVDLQAEAGNWKLRPEAAFGLARIVQEALTNAAKHAQGSAITVRLARNAGSLVCTVRDNGRGFAVGNAPVGVGLLTMRERAEALGGTLRIESAPDAGTTITVTLPM
jgi:signal transduction histidine kinase